jgi:hypothetical protein
MDAFLIDEDEALGPNLIEHLARADDRGSHNQREGESHEDGAPGDSPAANRSLQRFDSLSQCSEVWLRHVRLRCVP